MIDFNEYAPGQHRLECTDCGRGGRDKTLGLKVESDGSGVAHCFRCGYTESHHPDRVSVQHAPSLKLVAKPEVKRHTSLSDWGRELWDSTQELSGIAEDYLMHRHCALPPRYGDLRWHPSLKHPSGHVGPALVALVTDIYTDAPLSLHRTWITKTGKADVSPPRLLLANHSIDGGVIRLWPDDEVTGILGLAEGIETALSLAWAPMPVWAAIDAGHLAKFPLLNGIQTVVIAQDNDAAGVAAAGACAARWVLDLKQVFVTRQIQNDVNDELMGELHAC